MSDVSTYVEKGNHVGAIKHPCHWSNKELIRNEDLMWCAGRRANKAVSAVNRKGGVPFLVRWNYTSVIALILV
ncbi:hypothetical protein NDU88_004758 [Pleurodeles waltl]|uniref:Uncharacterized protein n=1 Tax=Pleurodeles waltl TaxID=8319 RepID=A0AAV7LJ45_PLEWA|nr:hypothetical protein NDU88_004758 [Pleurodeles waltl]